jgi:2-octaprenyl-6-methoxyphenol hydroxylase
VQSLRAAGLHLIGSFGPLRRLAMREGLAPSWRPRPRANIAEVKQTSTELSE